MDGAKDKMVIRKTICMVKTKSEGPDASSTPMVILGSIDCPQDNAGAMNNSTERVIFLKRVR